MSDWFPCAVKAVQLVLKMFTMRLDTFQENLIHAVNTMISVMKFLSTKVLIFSFFLFFFFVTLFQPLWPVVSIWVTFKEILYFYLGGDFSCVVRVYRNLVFLSWIPNWKPYWRVTQSQAWQKTGNKNVRLIQHCCTGQQYMEDLKKKKSVGLWTLAMQVQSLGQIIRKITERAQNEISPDMDSGISVI